MTRVVLFYAIQILGAAAFSATFLSNSVGGKPVKFHVKGQFSKINGLIISPLATRLTYELFVAGTFDADIVRSSDGNIDR